MRTRLMKSLRVAVLFFAFVSWGSMADYELVVRLVICAGAALVAIHGFRAAMQRWTIGALEIAFLFNLVTAPFRLAGSLGLVAIVLGAASLVIVSRTPHGISEPALSAQPTPIEHFLELQRVALATSAGADTPPLIKPSRSNRGPHGWSGPL
jgi:hypothetical protein